MAESSHQRRARFQFSTRDALLATSLIAISLALGRAAVWLYAIQARDLAGPAVMATVVSFFIAVGVISGRGAQGLIWGAILGIVCGRLCDAEFLR